MKMIIAIFSLAFVLSLSVAAIAGQGHGGGGHGGGHGGDSGQMSGHMNGATGGGAYGNAGDLGTCDPNNDGKLTMPEFHQTFPKGNHNHFMEMDTNGDGSLDRDEWNAFRNKYGNS